jgi:2-polyprenyl-3-methyl-5-hydroxy-6-metoxy-1,4-benzoquinol methylase
MSLQSPMISGLSARTEMLEGCPACDSSSVSLLHADLEDRLFGCPGKWAMWECRACGIAFLNPRLRPDTIGEAYLTYYTHRVAPKPHTLRVRFRNVVIRAYARRHLGLGSGLHLKWADWIVKRRLPRMCEGLLADYRYLPRPWRGAVLLDVGCGDGGFMRRVERLGWRAVGLELDPKACAVASARKLNVTRGAVPDTGLPAQSFDVITLHHVIEHVHDPRAVLHELFRLAKPNGRIILTTPNRRSFGADLFGRSWRGLEPPRHLVLFTPDALVKAVTDAGFVRPEVQVRPELAQFYFQQSHAIASSISPDSIRLPAYLEIELKRASSAAKENRNRAEEFTVIATRSGM